MDLELSLDYRTRWLDFDRYGRIQPTTVLDMMQDVATYQAEQMGTGRDAMIAEGVFWAIVRIRYEVVCQPRRGQVITVRTWPHTPTSFSFLRDFQMKGESGEELVNASSEWVLMDMETRKFARMSDHYDGPSNFSADRALSSKPRKLRLFDKGNREPYVVVPAYSDIDVNGHVNNARYPTFAVNALAPGPEKNVKALQIDYRHEVLPGAPLTVETLAESDRVLSKGVREDGNIAFACAMELD